MKGLLTSAQIAELYGVRVQTIHCGSSAWVRRGMPVAGWVPVRGGRQSRLFDPAAVQSWHAVHVAAARRQRKPASASITRNGRLLLSAGAVRLLSGRLDLPLGGGVMLFAVSLGPREIHVAYVAGEEVTAALYGVNHPGDFWTGTLAPTVISTSTYLRPPIAARGQCGLFGTAGPLRVSESGRHAGLPVLGLSRGRVSAPTGGQ